MKLKFFKGLERTRFEFSSIEDAKSNGFVVYALGEIIEASGRYSIYIDEHSSGSQIIKVKGLDIPDKFKGKVYGVCHYALIAMIRTAIWSLEEIGFILWIIKKELQGAINGSVVYKANRYIPH